MYHYVFMHTQVITQATQIHNYHGQTETESRFACHMTNFKDSHWTFTNLSMCTATKSGI